jgi:hypothetical protein
MTISLLRHVAIVATRSFLVLWLTLSVLEQLRVILASFEPAWMSRIQARLGQLSALLPRWTFFAPRPGTVDYHLCYRHRLATGEVTRWEELLGPEDPWFAFVWNPRKRMRKALVDMVTQLSSLIRICEGDTKPLLLSVPYLLLLQLVSACPKPDVATEVQFCLLVAANGAAWPRQIEPFLVSNMHRLGPCRQST